MRWVGAALVLISFTACGTEERPSAPSGDQALSAAVRALCDARDVAAKDLARARDIFLDAAHDRIHDLARAVTDENAAIAARLLEAKQRIESDLEDAAPKNVTEHFDRLIDAANDSLGELELEGPSC